MRKNLTDKVNFLVENPDLIKDFPECRLENLTFYREKKHSLLTAMKVAGLFSFKTLDDDINVFKFVNLARKKLYDKNTSFR